MKKSSGNTQKKKGGKAVNWFEAQAAKGEQSNAPQKPQQAKQMDFKPLDEAPIVKVQMKSKREAAHYEAAFAFAMRMSDAKSEERMTVHLNMQDELVFNMPEDESYEALWKKGELMLLVAFPRNWKTMSLNLSEDEEEDFDDLDTDEGRFDYLYETGMAIYEGK